MERERERQALPVDRMERLFSLSLSLSGSRVKSWRQAFHAKESSLPRWSGNSSMMTAAALPHLLPLSLSPVAPSAVGERATAIALTCLTLSHTQAALGLCVRVQRNPLASGVSLGAGFRRDFCCRSSGPCFLPFLWTIRPQISIH